MSKKRKSLESLNFSLNQIYPITESQELVFNSRKNLVLHGSSGTGKTFISLYLAFSSLAAKEYTNIMLIRSAVPTRDIGFLPGTEEEKSKVYEEPYRDICSDLFSRDDAYENLKAKNFINFMTTSFLRGLTFEDTFIIVDECQNMSFHELDSIITRVGIGSKIIFCGDFLQSDLTDKRNERSGLPAFLKILRQMEEFDCVEFGIEDIVRSEFVKNYLTIKHNLL